MIGRVLCACLATIATSITVSGAKAASPASATGEYEELALRVLSGRDADEGDYLDLDDRYEQLAPENKAKVAQLQSSADALFGDYRSAHERHAAAFNYPRPQACPQDVAAVAAKPAVLGLAQGADVLLVNEYHTLVYARAYVRSLLSDLRRQGYSILALEALYPLEGGLIVQGKGLSKADPGVDDSGWPLDRGEGGTYTREPIFAGLMREAHALGFAFVAYDAIEAESRDEREQAQAHVLADVARGMSGRMVVLAGGSHIWRTDGWMAQHLVKLLPEKRVVSIDIASGYQGCETPNGTRLPAAGEGPVVFRSLATMPESEVARVDLKVWMHVDPHGSRTWAWSSGSVSSRAIPFDARQCNGQLPCMVSAVRTDAVRANAVPEDRGVIRADGQSVLLNLSPGTYLIRATSGSNVRRSRIRISTPEQ